MLELSRLDEDCSNQTCPFSWERFLPCRESQNKYRRMVAIVWLPNNKELIALFCSTPNVLHTTFVSMNAIVAFAFHFYMSSLFGKKGRQEPPFISTDLLPIIPWFFTLFVSCFLFLQGVGYSLDNRIGPWFAEISQVLGHYYKHQLPNSENKLRSPYQR